MKCLPLRSMLLNVPVREIMSITKTVQPQKTVWFYRPCFSNVQDFQNMPIDIIYKFNESSWYY